MPAGRGTGPRANPRADRRVTCVAGHGLASHRHPCLDVAELTVAVRRLVEVHEVHVDLVPGQREVHLGVQVQQGLAKSIEPGDPRLCRRERVHPRDDTDALVTGARVDARPAYLFCPGEHGLPDQADADLRPCAQQVDYLGGLLSHLAQRLLAVECLAAGKEPAFERLIGFQHVTSLQIGHWRPSRADRRRPTLAVRITWCGSLLCPTASSNGWSPFGGARFSRINAVVRNGRRCTGS